jgi:uncharacterized membrane protein
MNVTSKPSPQRDGMLWLVITVFGAMLTWLSLARYAGFNIAMFDLGNMAQAIWSATQGRPLLYSSPSGAEISRLVGHAELIYFLLAPLYALWPDPRALLIVQAALFALGALPVYRMALRTTESRFAARCLAVIYLLYPTAQTSVLFDFHGDTLAMPILLFLLDALDARAWRRFAVLVVLALACKLYVAAPVAGIGAYMALWSGERRRGALTMGAALAYGLLVLLVVRPLFAPPELALQPTPAAAGAVSASYFSYYFGELSQIVPTLGDRLLSAVVVFGPALLLAWRGWRWLLPGLPVALAALITTGPGGAYDYRYHHYATVVPFIMMAAIEGTARMKRSGEPPARRRRTWRGDLGLTVGIVAIFSVLLVNTPLNPLFWLGAPGYGFDPAVYGVTSRDAVKARFLAERVAPGVPLASSAFLAPRLAERERLYMVRYPDEARPERLPKLLPRVQTVVADALFDYYVALDGGYGGGLDYDREAIGVLLRDPAFGLTGMRDGLLLFERGATPERVLANQVARRPDDGAAAVRQFGERVALVRAEVAQAGPGRLRATFVWRLTGSFPAGARYATVSRLEGVEDARFAHLPSYALLPAWEWRSGELVEERFEVELPEELAPGVYQWRLGWYNVANPAARFTDQRSLLPGSQEEAVAEVVVR